MYHDLPSTHIFAEFLYAVPQNVTHLSSFEIRLPDVKVLRSALFLNMRTQSFAYLDPTC